MKKRILKKSNAIFAAILALFGVSSCEQEDLYGCPQSEYSEDIEITGTVQNEAQHPIENIQVVSLYTNDTTYTDASGNFAFHTGKGLKPTILRLNLNDIDGAANCSYQDDTAEVQITYTGGDGNWNAGVGHGSVTKTLKEKTE